MSFKENILPGNYYLTKSMEMSRTTTSGTLWYTKKFLVYYYSIFLTNLINTREYVNLIIGIFDNYISSLPPEIQESAKEFFYSSNDSANLKSSNFRTFVEFAGNPVLGNERSRDDFFHMAKKYYFAFLMESGGQSGVNAHIKEYLYEEDFEFTEIDNIIQSFYPNPIPLKKLNQIKNDYMAFLRNERQILYYYGYFHSKSTGAKDVEFSSLTPIGELALRANSYEFLAIWEHQKIKMISQPVTVDIQNVSEVGKDPELFSISYSPYMNILLWLKNYKSIGFDEYKYIVSRLSEKNVIDQGESIQDIRNEVILFNRTGDIKDEDFAKELKKYTLGIRSDLPQDCNTNILGFCKIGRQTRLQITDENLLNIVSDNYSLLDSYKRERYSELFSSCEKEIRRQYVNNVRGIEYHLDKKIKVNWDMYNIHLDKLIIFGVIQSICCIKFGVESNNKQLEMMVSKFPFLLKEMGLSKNKLKKEIDIFSNSVLNKDYSYYLPSNEEIDYPLQRYEVDSSVDLFRKIQDISRENSTDFSIDRHRNKNLIINMKAYYIQRYSENETLKCECCNQETFITQNNEPYLEFHHLIPFSSYDGQDHYLNLFAICPLCHRKLHFIKNIEKEKYYQNLDKNNYLKKGLEERLKMLYMDRQLKSYQLEYLLSENAITEEVYNRIIA